MQWSKWRFLRLLGLLVLVILLGQKFLSENANNITLPLMGELNVNEKNNQSEPTLIIELPSRAPTETTNPQTDQSINYQPTLSQPTPTQATSADLEVISNKQTALPKKPQYVATSPTPFPVITDTEVIVALNQYRATHKIHQLVEHQSLCNYAQKRVEDLVAYGGLDHHQGFKQDFEDGKIPEQLKDYPGRTIGENLAYQYCINMQTKESFVANSATALIEWCFDSSTAGHREAQLNQKFNNVCVRHKNGLFVVIFGD